MTAIGAHHATPITFGAFRTALPTVVLLVLLKLGKIRLPRPRLALAAAGSGLFMVAFFSFASVDGVARAGAGDAAVLANSPPLWVAVLSWFIFRERVSRRTLVGLLIGFGGLVVMFSSELHLAGGNVALGMGMALAAGVGYAIATVTIKLVADRDEDLDPLGVLALQYMAGSPLLFVAALIVDGTGGAEWSSGAFWSSAMFVGTMSVVGAAAYVTSLKRLTATHTSVVVFLVPVVALAIEVFAGQSPDAVTFLGMFVVLCGVGLVSTAPRTERRHELRPLPRPAGMRAVTGTPVAVAMNAMSARETSNVQLRPGFH